MGLREQKKQQTRQSVLANSARLFAAQGFADTSMEQIAAAAMVSRTTLFNYFSSKDAIVLELASAFEDTYPDTVRRICAQPGSTEQRIRAAFAAAARYFTRHRALNSVIYLELTRIRSTRTDLNNAATQGYRDAFVTLLEAGIQQGDVRTDIDAEIIADVLWAPLSAGLYRIFSGDNAVDIEATFQDYASLLIDAVVRE